MERIIAGQMSCSIGSSQVSGPFLVLEADWSKRLEALRYGAGKWVLIDGQRRKRFVNDPRKINELEELYAHDASIVAGWGKEAKAVADGDPLLEQVLLQSIEYRNGSLEQPFDREGIAFWPIGHNSSHSWSAGVKDGAIHIHVFGECGEGNEEFIRRVEPGQSWGYVGHF